MHEQYIKDLLDLKDPHLKIMKIEHQGRNQIIHLKFFTRLSRLSLNVEERPLRLKIIELEKLSTVR